MVAGEHVPEVAARVRTMSIEADGVLSLELEAVEGELAAWQPGAHIDVEVAGAPVRQYSLCGEPGAQRYRIAVLREQHSRGGSAAVHERLRPGDEVAIKGLRNHFELEPAGQYLFIAGGIGITPILPMVRAVSDRGADWRLVYLGGHRRSMAFLEDVRAIDADRVTAVPRDEAPRIELATLLDEHPEAHVYACGPERLLEELRELIPDATGRLHYEYFSAPEVEYEPGAAFTVRLTKTGVDVHVDPEQSVLAAMQSVGVDVLTDCEEGICGSCETRVVEGTVEHRDFVLTSQERERMDCMMVCVSRASCPLLVLDA